MAHFTVTDAQSGPLSRKVARALRTEGTRIRAAAQDYAVTPVDGAPFTHDVRNRKTGRVFRHDMRQVIRCSCFARNTCDHGLAVGAFLGVFGVELQALCTQDPEERVIQQLGEDRASFAVHA